jgi:VWFA-related protein
MVVSVLLVVGRDRPFLAQQQPTFRSGVDVVAIDVNVVDRNGRPSEDLEPRDFIVTVDRKPRTILSATYINHAVRLPRDAARWTRPAVLDTLTGSTRADRTGRNVLIAVDEDSMEPGLGRAVLQAAHAFVDDLAPPDRVAVATIPRLQSELSFDSDRAVVHRALDSVVTQVIQDAAGEFRIGMQEAYDIERRDATVTKKVVDRECRCDFQPGRVSSDATAGAPARAVITPGTGQTSVAVQPCDSVCPSLVVSEANQYALRARLRAQRSLDALRDLGQALARIPGAKTLVFVSGGLGIPETTLSLDPLEPALSVGQVSLYTLHVERSQFGQVRSRLSPTQVEDDRLLIYGLENATSAAGGTLISVLGPYQAAFDRIITEMSGSYLLALEVDPTDRDGKPHAVAVKVNRPDVEVRARRQYVIDPDRSGLRRGDQAASPPPPTRRAGTPGRATLPAEVAAPLVGLLSRAAEWVGSLDSQIPGLLCDEQYEQTLSRWKAGAVVERGVSRSTEAWFVEKRSRLSAEYALVRVPGGTGWTRFRDVIEADGGQVHQRNGRLRRVLETGDPQTLSTAERITAESARFDIGFGQRTVNIPTFALAFLQPATRSRFSFREEGEVPVDGQPAAQIGYEERARPTVFLGRDNRDLPVRGSFWIAPDTGALLRSSMQLTIEVDLDRADVDIIVTFKPSPELAGLWVPSEMHEIYTTAAMKLDCVARYGNYRLIGNKSRPTP